MDIKRRSAGRPTGEPKRRIELQLTQDVLDTIDRLKGPVDRSAWVAMMVQGLNTVANGDTGAVEALVKFVKA